MSTWRELAGVLAERLSYQAELCGQRCEHSPVTSFKTARECPFCADHAAYTHWRTKERMASSRRARPLAAASPTEPPTPEDGER